MKIWKESLYKDNEKVYFQAYLQENFVEIDPVRKRPLMIVVPGGGYITTSDREAEPVALGWLSWDYHVIVLRYTTEDRGSALYPNSLLDLARLMGIIHENADQWFVDEENIFACGFSAGGHLVLSLAAHWHESWLAEMSNVPNALLKLKGIALGYPMVDYIFQNEKAKNTPEFHLIDPVQNASRYDAIEMINEVSAGKDADEERFKEISPDYHISESMVPVFVWGTSTDDFIFVGNTLKLGLALEKHKIPFEMHIFPYGPHGMSMATSASCGPGNGMDDKKVAKWLDMAADFFEGLIEKA